jgi:carbonic anhydrase
MFLDRMRPTHASAVLAGVLLVLSAVAQAAEGRSSKADSRVEPMETGKASAKDAAKAGTKDGSKESGKGAAKEASSRETERGESTRSDARRSADDVEGVRRDRAARRAREPMNSDEAIEELSTRIAQKLATIKSTDGKGEGATRVVVKNPVPVPPRPTRAPFLPTDVARSAAVANGQPVPSLQRVGAELAATAAPVATPAPIAAPQAAVGVRRPAAAAPPSEHRHWTYFGDTGPENWARLDPEYGRCAVGNRQSPIDIRDGIKVDLDPIAFDYRPSGFSVLDNGHTVQVNLGMGNAIVVNGRRYELLQFHFHRPSEERVAGRTFDMVAHLVHKDAEGRLAVVAVLIDRGASNSVIQQVWNNLPLERGDPLTAQSPIDVSALLPKERGYWTFMGSLTTPPCTEGVLWMVLKQPVQVSTEQIAVFGRLYPMNARPVQQTSGRMIKESN